MRCSTRAPHLGNGRGFPINLLSISLTGLAISPATTVAPGEDAKQAAFERVFGEAAKLDPEMVQKVKAVPPEKLP